jgi:hypothetical protein
MSHGESVTSDNNPLKRFSRLTLRKSRRATGGGCSTFRDLAKAAPDALSGSGKKPPRICQGQRRKLVFDVSWTDRQVQADMTTISPALAFRVFAPPRRNVNRRAIFSLTVAILQFLLPFVPAALVTVPLALNALSHTETSDREGRGLAIAALALSVAHFVSYVTLFVWLLV